MRIRAWVSSLAFLFVAVAFCAIAVAQPGGPPQGGGPRGPGGFGGPFGGGGLIGLAARDEVQQELQLVDEQKDKVRDLADDMRNKAGQQMRSMFRDMQDLSDEERRAKFGEIQSKAQEMAKDADKKLEGILLPHQLERLKQIDLQNKIRQRGSDALTNGDVAEALNLTDDQRDKLEKRAAEVQQELDTKIKELRADARKKVIDVLTPDQQAQLQKMMGDSFDLKDQGFGGFQGRFGPGGPGGQDRGGRNRGGNRGDDQSKSGKDAA